MTKTGRIENEPNAVYFGPSDKPAFGSSAIKEWIREPELFYRRYITKEILGREASPAMDIGTATDEKLLCGIDRVMVSKYKTRCKAFTDEQADNPDKLILTPGEAEKVDETVSACQADPDLGELVKLGTSQVVYRIDHGAFYLQARVDLEVNADVIPERIADATSLPKNGTSRCLIDLKTCASHYGQSGFKRMALRSPLDYPVQQALYCLVAEKVLKTGADSLPFRFAAVAKDNNEVKFYDLLDDGRIRRRVADAIGELSYRMKSGDWDDYAQKCVQVFIPEYYLSGE